eukprot:5183128-Pleurochrysis_carterae.AAC.2
MHEAKGAAACCVHEPEAGRTKGARTRVACFSTDISKRNLVRGDTARTQNEVQPQRMRCRAAGLFHVILLQRRQGRGDEGVSTVAKDWLSMYLDSLPRKEAAGRQTAEEGMHCKAGEFAPRSEGAWMRVRGCQCILCACACHL